MDWTIGFDYSIQNFSTTANNIAMAGNYTLAVTDAQGCKGYKQVNLMLDPKPRVNLVRSNNQSCIPFCSDFKFETSTAPIATSLWQINGQNISGESFNYCFTKAGTYTLKGDITDTRSCSNSLSFVIDAYPAPQADFDYFPQEPVEGEEIQLESTSKGIELQNYTWYFINNTLQRQDTRSIVHSFLDAGAYPITLMVKNKWGCEDTASKTITVMEDFSIYVPNAFTPNDDNMNQYFKAVGRGVKTFSIQIFDRWGELIHQSNDILSGWDGNYKGKPCKEDVYAWQIEVTSLKGKEQKLSGSVLLYR
jgi:gliding motility-associated-like protein